MPSFFEVSRRGVPVTKSDANLKPRNGANNNTNSQPGPHGGKYGGGGGGRHGGGGLMDSEHGCLQLFMLLLVFGLLFCMIDMILVMKYLMDQQQQQQQHLGNSNSNNCDPNLPQPLPRPSNVLDRDSAAAATVMNLPQQRKAESMDNAEMPNANVAANIEADTRSYEDLIAGKEPIIELLKDAGITDLDKATLAKIPLWSEVTALYGENPVYFGLETCQTFQQSGRASDHFVTTAGTFNTGTNLMAELLIHNCHMPARMAEYGPRSRGVRWQVLWGKHTPVDDEAFRQEHRTYNESSLMANDMFPAVMVRDPFKWMQSMCRHEYGAHWFHDASHCPNLVPNPLDQLAYPELTGLDSVPVMVKYSEFTKYHNSLAGFWNDWYNAYVRTATWPHLMVRFEDVLYHPREVTKTACECAGGKLNVGDFRYVVQSAKKGSVHGTDQEKTSYVDALIRYGTERGRYQGYEQADLDYAREYLDADLMDLFNYKQAPMDALTNPAYQ